MKIVIVGAPGAGKSWLARHVSQQLGLKHIEADTHFWQQGREVSPETFQSAIQLELQSTRWVCEGHFAKLFPLLAPHAPRLIVIREESLVHLARSFGKDLRQLVLGPHRKIALARMAHHLRFWTQMRNRRQRLVTGFAEKHPEKIFTWRGDTSDLNELYRWVAEEGPANFT